MEPEPFYIALMISLGFCFLAMILTAVASREDEEKIKDLNYASIAFLVVGFGIFIVSVSLLYRDLKTPGKLF